MSVLHTWPGGPHARHATGMGPVPGVRPARVRPPSHARQAHRAHQALHALAVGGDALARKEQNHAAAYRRRGGAGIPRRSPAHHCQFVRGVLARLPASVEARARHAGERTCTLACQGERLLGVDPLHTGLRAHGTDFFSSQSSSLFSRPISSYSRSSSARPAALPGPRLPSKSVAACSPGSFFH